jgi:hypothetical protein
MLAFSGAFDAAMTCAPVAMLVAALMEGHMVCGNLDCMWRAPVPEAPLEGGDVHHQVRRWGLWHAAHCGVLRARVVLRHLAVH